MPRLSPSSGANGPGARALAGARAPSRTLRVLVVFLSAVPFAACGAESGATAPGVLQFQERVPTDDGLSATLYTRPARRVRVEALDADGSVVATVQTDEAGTFAVPADAVAVRALSVVSDPATIRVVDSAGVPYLVDFDLADAAGAVYTVPATDAAQTAGAFNILDVGLRVTELVVGAAGTAPPPIDVTWQLGNSGQMALGLPVGPSCYRRDPTNPVIVLEGGVMGRVAETATAHFDDDVIAHEWGHFVQDRLSYDASLGGGHDGNNLYFSLALAEGFATWLACVALGDSVYISTIGQPPTPQLNYANYDIENVDNIPGRAFGNDSEFTVSEVLWDLYDGSPGSPADRDQDGVALPFADIFGAFTDLDAERDYPYLTSVLQALEARGALTRDQIQRLLSTPVEQNVPYPPVVVWPLEAALGHSYQMEIGLPDGLDLAPTLFDGSVFLNQFWRVEVSDRGGVRATLDVDPFDLDPPVSLDLLTNANEPLGGAAAPPFPIVVEALLDPGLYVARVRSASRAHYTVSFDMQ